MGLAITNNNPGNLRDTKTGAFRKFNSPEEGYAALMNDLQAKITGASSTGLNGNSTIYEFAKTYAPRADNNDPEQYTVNLVNQLKVRPDTRLSELKNRVPHFAYAVAKNEDGEFVKRYSFTRPPGEVQEQSEYKVPEMPSTEVDNGFLVEGLKAGVKSAVDLPVAIGGGLQNAIRAGGRAFGMNTPAQTSYPSLLGTKSEPVAPIGYNEQGQELGPGRTALQLGGAGLEAASYLATPELAFLAKMGKASPLSLQFLRGLGRGAVTGAEYGTGEALRTNPEDVPEALKTGAITSALGAGIGGTAALGSGVLSNILGKTKNFEEKLKLANDTGSKDEAMALLQSPEGQTYLKSAGFNTLDDAVKKREEIVGEIKQSIIDYYAGNPAKQSKLQNLDDEAIGNYIDYSANNPPKVTGGKFDTSDAYNAMVVDQDKSMAKMNLIMDALDTAGVDVSMSKQAVIRDVAIELDRIATANPEINKELALKQIMNKLNNVSSKETISLKQQDTLRKNANKTYPTDPERSTKEAADEALGNTIRNYHTNIIERGAANGNIDSVTLQAYKDLNQAWGALENSKVVAQAVARTTKQSQGPRFLPEITAGIASGGFNPLVYWGTQAVARKVLNSVNRLALLNKFPLGKNKVLSNSIQDTFTNTDAVVEQIAKHLTDKEVSIWNAEQAIARRGLPVAPPVPDTYIPDNKLPTIEMGPKAQSRFKQDTGLPNVDTPPNVATPPLREPYTPDSKLPTINFAGGVAGLAGLTQMDATMRSGLDNNATTSLGISSVNPETKVSMPTKDNPIYSAYDKEIAIAEKLVESKLGKPLPRGFLKAIIAQESSFGTNDNKYNKKLGENAWLVGLTDVAKTDIKNRMRGDFAIDPSLIDTNTVQGAINSAAIYAGLRMRPIKEMKSDGTRVVDQILAVAMKDPENLYKAYNGKGTKNAEKDFKKRLDYINSAK